MYLPFYLSIYLFISLILCLHIHCHVFPFSYLSVINITVRAQASVHKSVLASNDLIKDITFDQMDTDQQYLVEVHESMHIARSESMGHSKRETAEEIFWYDKRNALIGVKESGVYEEFRRMGSRLQSGNV